VDYMHLHAIIDNATLSGLKLLRIDCEDDHISFDAAVHHQDVLDRMHLPALERVAVEISSQCDVSDAELLMPFSSAARRGILTYDINTDPNWTFDLFS
jgi:hypothetical protein